MIVNFCSRKGTCTHRDILIRVGTHVFSVTCLRFMWELTKALRDRCSLDVRDN